MDLINLIKTRRSVRIFQDKKIDRETVKKIIEAATYAPSACNVQGWRFIVIDDEKKKQEIVDNGGSINIKKAPLGILTLYDNRTKNTEYLDNIQSGAAAIQNMLLTVHNLGLGACWICHLPSKRDLRKIFNIPKTMSPVAYILIGHKKQESREMPRKYNLGELIGFNEFSSNINQGEKQSNLLIKKILTKTFLLLPAFIKKRWLNKYLDKNFVKKFKN